MILTMR
jgi:HAD superfamily hydrolase (TIGR01509 family)